MNFNDYQEKARETAIYPSDKGLEYTALLLAEEASEAAGKIAKYLRDGTLSEEAVAKEIGDSLWAAANLAHEIGYDLNTIAQMNLDKLADRAKRGVISGSGDNR